MSLDTLTIPEAAEKYHLDPKRLRGAIHLGNIGKRWDAPAGCLEQDLVHDDHFLRWYAESTRVQKGNQQ